ncbi:MAG TPA: MGMT family protein [Candidatus Saccharimonadales bacterium]|nr:MGMT family protein [Candidatus Saccharimonadales bacterium]
MNEYQKSILTVVQSIPYGKVMSYGQVAAYIGKPKEAREVGWMLQKLDADFPWWRVLNNAGLISIKDNPQVNAQMQKELLEKEGIVVDGDFKLDMSTYRYYPNEATLKQLHLDPEYIEALLIKYTPIDKDEPLQLALF